MEPEPAAAGPDNPSLAPGLLIAVPQLVDGNFHRSVVFLIEQNEEGAFGVVINRPSEIKVGELLANLGIGFEGAPDGRVLIGGPVSPDRGLVLHRDGGMDDDAREVAESLWISATPSSLKRLFEHTGGPPALCFAGYAGWGPGQLEQELEQGAWIPAPYDETLLFTEDRGAIWDKALRGLGIDPTLIVPGGSVN